MKTQNDWCELVMLGAIIFALLQPAQNLYAQNRPVKFERLSVAQGLSQSSVRCILQDRQGFMWFGTHDGLNKYDGYNFTVYRHDALDSSSLSDNDVLSIYEDRAGTLWVGTPNGLNLFDREKAQFTRFVNDPNNPHSLSNHDIASIYEDSASPNTLWIGTWGGGLNRFDREKAQFTRFANDPNNPHSLSNNNVTSIYEDSASRNTLWIGTFGGGLNKFDRAKERFTCFVNDPNNPHSLSNNRIWAIYEDRAGTLWIGTPNGLNRFDRAKERFTRFVNDPKNPHSLSENNILSIYEDSASRNTLWIGTGNGLNLFDRATEQFTRFVKDPKNLHSLSENNIRSIYEDRAGTLWIGTGGGGLNKFDRAKERFIHFANDPNNPHTLSENNIGSIYEDHAGTLWIGTWGGGLNKFDRAKERFIHFVNDPKNPHSLNENWVSSIYEDHTGTLWIGTGGGGLNKFDRAKERFIHFVNDPKNPHSLSNNVVKSIYKDSLPLRGTGRNTLWIGTWRGGLNKLVLTPASGGINSDEGSDREKAQFTRFVNDSKDPHSLSNIFVTSIYEDHAGTLWIGTWGGGLNKFDRETGQFTHYTEKDGLPNDAIIGILEDDHGRLWLSTNKGLSRFGPQTKTFRNYDITDGLQSNEFNEGAYHKSKSGEMFFGGINGFNAFHPDSIKDNPYLPPVVITALKRYNTDETADLAIEEKGISVKPAIELTYKDNFLWFEFAALSFRHPEKNQYAYKLEGYSDKWIHLGTKRDVTFTNLDPGEYTLRVKGSNNDGVWNEEGTLLKITIMPPWWRTRWAYAIYALLVIAVIFATDRIQRRRLLKKERERAEAERKDLELKKAAELKVAYEKLTEAHGRLKATQQQLITQEKLASLGQLTAGIAHEIKNPLNFVNNFAALSVDLAKELDETLESSQDKKVSEVMAEIKDILATLQQNAEKINHHGKRADGIVKSMMQHARGSSGQREPTDVNRLLDEAVSLVYHGLRANDPSFNVTIEKDYDESIGKLEVVPQDLSRVFLNVVNNACYAAHQKKKDTRDDFSPTLSVSTKKLNGRIEIRIRDNGNGIPAEIREKIFNPFFTMKPTGQGTGLGLSISYDIIVQQHRGEIKVETEEGKFTEFVVQLPRKA